MKAGQGNPEVPFKFELPDWEDARRRLRSQVSPRADPMRIQSRVKSAASGRPATSFQKVLHAHHAAGHQLRDLHQVHAVLAELSGCLVRRHRRKAPTTPIWKPAAVAAFAKQVCPVKDASPW